MERTIIQLFTLVGNALLKPYNRKLQIKAVKRNPWGKK